MQNLSQKNKIIIGICVVLLVVILGLIIGFVVKKNKNNNEPVKTNTDVREMLSNASKLEVTINEDKEIEFNDFSNLDVNKNVKLWVFSNPIYLGELTIVNNDGKYYIDGIEAILNSKYITSGNHQILVLQDDKVVGYFNISLSSGTLLSNKEMSNDDTSKSEETPIQDNNKENNAADDKNDQPANNTVNKEDNKNKEETTTKEIEVFEDIKYTTEEIKETNMLKSKKETVETGENGQKKITYKVTYDKNNKEIKREKISEVVVKEPKNAKVKVGLSDYNLNDKPTYGLETGLFCLEDEVSSFDYKQCNDEGMINKTNYYQTITVGNKQYLICMDGSICSDYYDYQFELSSYPTVSKYKEIYTTTFNGTKYYLDPRAGSDGNELTEEICTKLGLVCNRW